jgi:transcriptional regulator with XRE-family HTH domain
MLMMEYSNINWSESSDEALQAMIGQFIQMSRIRKNKSQLEVSKAAGINRSTLSQIENGRGGTLITLIQILRVLDQLSFLKVFQVEDRPSPMYLATLDMKKRKRARNVKGPKPYDLPDW